MSQLEKRINARAASEESEMVEKRAVKIKICFARENKKTTLKYRKRDLKHKVEFNSKSFILCIFPASFIVDRITLQMDCGRIAVDYKIVTISQMFIFKWHFRSRFRSLLLKLPNVKSKRLTTVYSVFQNSELLYLAHGLTRMLYKIWNLTEMTAKN